MNELKGYVLRFSLFTGLLFFLSILFYFFADKRFVSDVFLFIVPFFFLTGLLSKFILLQAAKKNEQQFALVSMAFSLIRLLFLVIIMVIYSLLFRNDAYPFMIAFFTFYLLFKAFDVILVYKSAR